MSRHQLARRTTFRPAAESLGERLAPAVFTVTSTADSGAGTLRDAILLANANPGQDTINFNLPLASGVATITPLSELPEIRDLVTIDGRSQPGYAGHPIVELNGSMAGAGADGLRLAGIGSDGSTVRGLVVNRFSGDGIELRDCWHATVAGCYVGTDATGTLDRGNGVYGIHVNGSSFDRIGTGNFADINVVSGNDGSGVAIRNGSTQTSVYGNFIGLDYRAISPVGNGTGLLIENSSYNHVGNTYQTWGGNVISGNGGPTGGDGVNIRGATATGNELVGNRIGLNTATNAPAPNYNGVLINGAPNTRITDNTISWNYGSGVVLMGYGTTGTVLLRNRIGTSPANLYNGVPQPRPNHGDGVLITGGAHGNTIGSWSWADQNIIAFNGGFGVHGVAGNTVTPFNQIFGNVAGQII